MPPERFDEFTLHAILGRRWRAVDQRHSYEVEWDDGTVGWVGADEVYGNTIEEYLNCALAHGAVNFGPLPLEWDASVKGPGLASHFRFIQRINEAHEPKGKGQIRFETSTPSSTVKQSKSIFMILGARRAISDGKVCRLNHIEFRVRWNYLDSEFDKWVLYSNMEEKIPELYRNSAMDAKTWNVKREAIRFQWFAPSKDITPSSSSFLQLPLTPQVQQQQHVLHVKPKEKSSLLLPMPSVNDIIILLNTTIEKMSLRDSHAELIIGYKTGYGILGKFRRGKVTDLTIIYLLYKFATLGKDYDATKHLCVPQSVFDDEVKRRKMIPAKHSAVIGNIGQGVEKVISIELASEARIGAMARSGFGYGSALSSLHPPVPSSPSPLIKLKAQSTTKVQDSTPVRSSSSSSSSEIPLSTTSPQSLREHVSLGTFLNTPKNDISSSLSSSSSSSSLSSSFHHLPDSSIPIAVSEVEELSVASIVRTKKRKYSDKEAANEAADAAKEADDADADLVIELDGGETAAELPIQKSSVTLPLPFSSQDESLSKSFMKKEEALEKWAKTLALLSSTSSSAVAVAAAAERTIPGISVLDKLTTVRVTEKMKADKINRLKRLNISKNEKKTKKSSKKVAGTQEDLLVDLSASTMPMVLTGTEEDGSKMVNLLPSLSDESIAQLSMSTAKSIDDDMTTMTMTTTTTTATTPLSTPSLLTIDSSISTAPQATINVSSSSPTLTTTTTTTMRMSDDLNVNWMWKKSVRDFVHHKLSRNQLDYLSEIGATDIFGSPNQCIAVTDEQICRMFSMEQSQALFELKLISSTI